MGSSYTTIPYHWTIIRYTEQLSLLLNPDGLMLQMVLLHNSKRKDSYSNAELGEAVFAAMYGELRAAGVSVAAQCCEHLNRALIMTQADAERFGYEEVNVMPQLKAGGSFATAAWKVMEHPVAVERVQAHAGIDIGDTLIGMHLKPVAVPVRIEHPMIGGAHIVCARTRPKYVGGERAHYNEALE